MITEAALAALLWASPSSHPLVVTLSADRVEITSNFTGAGMVVFGAIDAALAENSEIVVVVRGPQETITVRRRDRVLGLWLNTRTHDLEAMPAFYALHASAPVTQIADDSVRTELGLGLDTYADPTGVEFMDAAIRLLREEGHYVEEAGTVERLGNGVFRVGVDLPADISIGAYTVDVFLFASGSLVGVATKPLEVGKTGVEQFIAEASRDRPWAYAAVMVVFAIGAGWLGGLIFRRD